MVAVVPVVALQQFLAAIQAGDLDGAIALGEAILRAEPSNATVRKAMPMICLRRDQLSLLRRADAELAADGDDDGDDEGAPAGADSESDESDESDDSDEDEDEEDDDESEDEDDEGEEEEQEQEEGSSKQAGPSAPQIPVASRDKPVISALRKLLDD